MSNYFGTPASDESLQSVSEKDTPMAEGKERVRDYSIPADTYNGVITDAETRKSGSGNTMTVVTVELTEGEHKGKSFKNFYVTKSSSGETLRGKEFLQRMMKDLNAKETTDLVHQYCSVVLGEPEEYNGVIRNRVKWINRKKK